MMRILLILALSSLTAFASILCSTPAKSAYPEPVAGENGMVVTSQHLASDIGAEILHEGGNAIDAAVAVGYALAVVDPCCGNIGGGGFMTVRFADGHSTFLDFREHAPLAATETMYQDASGKIVPGLSREGYLSVGVPGTVMGLEEARQRWGTLSRDKLISPAIALARGGFLLNLGDIEVLEEGIDAMRKDPAAAAIFMHPDGTPYRAGERLVQKDLAASLKLIAQKGPDVFYRGDIGAAIVKASAAHRGIIRQADLGAYKTRELPPLQCSYRGYTITSSPPPSSGGTTLCEILNILEGYPLDAWGFHSAASTHVLIEAMRYGFTDRNNSLGDPAFIKNPIDHLIDKAYAASLRAKIDPNHAGIAIPAPAAAEKRETTHYSVVDKAGNAVGVTYTLNGAFGAGVVADDTGIVLNDEMDDFTSKVGSANMFALAQGRANAIAPGKTPLSSMTPTIVSKDGKPVMVIGAAGGPTIITSVLQAIVNVVDYKMTISAAINAPRIHFQGLPNVVMLEHLALSADTERLLTAMGYSFKDIPRWGNATGILIGGPSLATPSPDSRFRYFGAADARRSRGAAVGD